MTGESGSVGSEDLLFNHQPLFFHSQFEDAMVDICLKLLDMSHKHTEDPAEDSSARCDPVYVGRVVSAMVGHVYADWSSLRTLLLGIRGRLNWECLSHMELQRL